MTKGYFYDGYRYYGDFCYYYPHANGCRKPRSMKGYYYRMNRYGKSTSSMGLWFGEL